MQHIFDQDDLLLLAHIVCKSEVLNKDTPHSYTLDAYGQDTHDSLYPFNYMCVHAFQSNYPLKGLHTFRGSKSKSCVSQSLHYIRAYLYFKL